MNPVPDIYNVVINNLNMFGVIRNPFEATQLFIGQFIVSIRDHESF